MPALRKNIEHKMKIAYFSCKAVDQDKKNDHLKFAAILATLSSSSGLFVSKIRCLLQFPLLLFLFN